MNQITSVSKVAQNCTKVLPGKIYELLKRLASLIVLLSLSCSENEFPEKVASFTIEVADDFVEENYECFIYATDASGAVLGFYQCENGGTYQINTEGALQADLTLVKVHHIYDGSKSFRFDTYVNLRGDKHISLKPTSLPDYGNMVSPTSISVKNFTNSCMLFSNNSSYYRNAMYVEWIEDDIYLVEFNKVSQPSEVLLTGYRLQEPVYYSKKDLKGGENIEIDFSSFIPHDKHLSLQSIPGVISGSSFGYYSTEPSYYPIFNSILDVDGYYLNETSTETCYDPSFTPSRLSYISGFDYYLTRIISNVDDHYTTYIKFGEMPHTISWPIFTSELIDASIQNANIAFSSPFAFKRISWFGHLDGGGFSWTIYSDSETQSKVLSIPASLKSKFPMLALENSELIVADFYVTLDGYSYNEFVQDTFGEKKKFFEYFETTIWY